MREEESLNKELRAAVEALTAKAARYKRECREQGVLHLFCGDHFAFSLTV